MGGHLNIANSSCMFPRSPFGTVTKNNVLSSFRKGRKSWIIEISKKSGGWGLEVGFKILWTFSQGVQQRGRFVFIPSSRMWFLSPHPEDLLSQASQRRGRESRLFQTSRVHGSADSGRSGESARPYLLVVKGLTSIRAYSAGCTYRHWYT